MSIEVVSLDFAGVIAPKDFIDFFWFFVIPSRIASLERIALYEAIKFVEREYWSTPANTLEWYLPSYWLKRFGLEAEEDELIEEALAVAKPYGDALIAIPILASRFRVVIATNTPRKFVAKFLERYPQIGRHVSRVFSCLDDYAKPRKDREFFLRVAEELGVEPKNVLHVGDDPVADYSEALAAGLRALLMDRSARFAGRHLRNLYQLLEYLP